MLKTSAWVCSSRQAPKEFVSCELIKYRGLPFRLPKSNMHLPISWYRSLKGSKDKFKEFPLHSRQLLSFFTTATSPLNRVAIYTYTYMYIPCSICAYGINWQTIVIRLPKLVHFSNKKCMYMYMYVHTTQMRSSGQLKLLQDEFPYKCMLLWQPLTGLTGSGSFQFGVVFGRLG